MNLTLHQIAEVIGARLSLRSDRAVTGLSIDTRTLKCGELFFALRGEKVDGHSFVSRAEELGASGSVVSIRPSDCSPSFPLLLVDDTREALRRLGRFLRASSRATFIGITGSNGKTTTREMTYAILRDVAPTIRSKKNYNTDIGLSLTLTELEPSTRYAVLELATNALGEMRELQGIARPEVSALTCVAPAHLEGLGSPERIADEKGVIFREARYSIIPHNDPLCLRAVSPYSCRRLTFGLTEGADVRAEEIRRVEQGILFRWEGREILLEGGARCEVMNALCAITIAVALGIEAERIAESLPRFQRQPLRMQVIERAGAQVILDCYNANPASMNSAVEELEERPASRRILICGDMLELGDENERLHRELGLRLSASSIDLIYFIGELSRFAFDEARKHRPQTVHYYESLETFSDHIPFELTEGDLVLIKASRGMELERLVEKLPPRQ